ncbi:PH and SEC7 domain-containing protein 1-like isoform X2 [Eucyclogobius newberryi]|uniref:PH and SEC7 domain-containing protein 1-like isoform X2 n=1 Tax=Eucyclogobius newberryi TaxID=166745 RepID=UPI003B5BEEF7
MSQSGKVLHLYVEVRSAPDQKAERSEEENPTELLSKLTNPSKTSTSQCLAQERTPKQSPSKHSVSFQLQNSPKVAKSWTSPCHNIQSPPRYVSPKCIKKEDVRDRQRSVVTFSYVEKSNVKTVESPIRDQSHFRKRLSDPVWFGSPTSSFSSSPYRSPGHQQYLPRQAPVFDPIGRAATQRAVEEFGSPLLRIKLAHALENSDYLQNRKPRCQSWAGSPLCKKQQMHSHVETQSPRHLLQSSPASQRQYEDSTTHCTDKVEGMNQLSESKSPANSPEVARKLVEKVIKVSTSLVAGNCSPLHNPPSSAQQCKMNIPLTEQLTPTNSNQPENSQEANNDTKPIDCHQKYQHPSSIHSSPAIPSRLVRPVNPPAETSSPVRDPRLSQGEPRAPDTPTLHRYQPPQYMGDVWTPRLDLREDFEKGDCTEIARRLYIKENVGGAPVSWTSRQQWGDDELTSPRQSPEFGFVLNSDTLTTLPSQPGKKGKLLSPKTKQKQAEQRRREILLLGPVALESADEDEGCDEDVAGQGQNDDKESPGENGGEVGGSSSRSSSGVTGSVGEQDCVSPESSETGAATSGIQTDSGSAAPVPSLHCQKIARAKWEFLFGPPAEETAGRKEKNGVETTTAPPSGNSSESPTPTPPSFLPLLSANHEVQHVEVELVTPPPAVVGTSPKTGIIRRTLKYSETDLDAVPMRCYRETDIDEVLMGEQEDADSAFGSNRSVQGNSGIGSNPLGGDNPWGDAKEQDEEEEDEDQNEEENEQEDDEEEEEEEMVSWASVRMQGDERKRLHGSRDDPEVFEPNRPEETFFDNHHPSLKTPILVSGPRLTAEDTFSRHFESIMESHRAKGTSYNSLDSEEILTSTTQTVLTFDLPTLTPAIHGPVCQSARQIVQLSFAPLAHDERPSFSDSMFTMGGGGDSDATRAPSSERLSSGSESTPPRRREAEHKGSPWYSNSSFPMIREKARLATDSELDLSERLGLSSSDTLTNGSHRADLAAAQRLAKRLFNLDGFRKSDVARHLSKNNDFSRMVAEEYLSFFNFTGLTLDQALRAFLRQFALVGETQERERVLSHFSRRYFDCNPKVIPSEDAVHTLTCALMLLNTDLHGQNIGKRMSCTQFVSNLEGLNDGQDFPRDQLKALYNSIKNRKLQWTLDEEELRKSFSELGDSLCESDTSKPIERVDSSGKSLDDGTHPSRMLLYKNGFLVRKVHADSDGKRTPRGKRGWKTFYAILKGLILYLQKGEYRPDKQLSDDDLKNAVSIHHSLAMKASDYSKRPNVFYLRTADWRVYLFQAPNAEQMQSWITRINTVAAMFSSPPFPAAIGSQKKFSRPLLPGTMSRQTEDEQVRCHEAKFRAVSTELSEVRSCPPPDRKVKGRELDEYRQRDEYLEFEKTRYGTYIMLLRAKLRTGEEDLSVFESLILEENGGLQRVQSSPTLGDSSLASQASSTKDGPNSSKASCCSTKPRQEAQRHSYRQAVKK